jgi:hypothetical protein
LTSLPSYFVLLPLPSLTLPCLEHDRPAQTQSPSRLRAPPPFLDRLYPTQSSLAYVA